MGIPKYCSESPWISQRRPDAKNEPLKTAPQGRGTAEMAHLLHLPPQWQINKKQVSGVFNVAFSCFKLYFCNLEAHSLKESPTGLSRLKPAVFVLILIAG